MCILEGYTVHMSEQLNERMDRVLNVMISLNTKVDRNHAELTGKVDALDGRITVLEDKVDRNHAELLSKHAEVMAKLEELASR